MMLREWPVNYPKSTTKSGGGCVALSYVYDHSFVETKVSNNTKLIAMRIGLCAVLNENTVSTVFVRRQNTDVRYGRTVRNLSNK